MSPYSIPRPQWINAHHMQASMMNLFQETSKCICIFCRQMRPPPEVAHALDKWEHNETENMQIVR